ncbi:flagellar basal body rod protein FlgB [Frigidibacter oleivorans]|uniref:flagellar basal body rod protein FlgB n=1 Tax=Frigidibacter oleivorans TaxID=2487129 RepID=UPI000F8E9E48|nr:flagellar basal body rod protein FlgB [Frigidibacter oleivorans]
MTLDLRSHLGLHAEALSLHERRGAILAANIANAATPGYKARDIDFAEALRQATGTGPMAVTSPAHFAAAAGTGGGGAAYRQPVSPALDGNTVELAVEQVAFSEAVLRQTASLELLDRRIGGLRKAIRGE